MLRINPSSDRSSVSLGKDSPEEASFSPTPLHMRHHSLTPSKHTPAPPQQQGVSSAVLVDMYSDSPAPRPQQQGATSSPSYMERFLLADDKEAGSFITESSAPPRGGAFSVMDDKTSSLSESPSSRDSLGATVTELQHVEARIAMLASEEKDKRAQPDWRQSAARLGSSQRYQLPQRQVSSSSVPPSSRPYADEAVVGCTSSLGDVNISAMTEDNEALLERPAPPPRAFSEHSGNVRLSASQPQPHNPYTSPPPGECVERVLSFKPASPLSAPRAAPSAPRAQALLTSPSPLPPPGKKKESNCDDHDGVVMQRSALATSSNNKYGAVSAVSECTPALSIASFLTTKPSAVVVHIEISPGHAVPFEIVPWKRASQLAEQFMTEHNLLPFSGNIKQPLTDFMQRELDNMATALPAAAHAMAQHTPAEVTEIVLDEFEMPNAKAKTSKDSYGGIENKTDLMSSVRNRCQARFEEQCHDETAQRSTSVRRPQPTKASLLRAEAAAAKIELAKGKSQERRVEEEYAHFIPRRSRSTTSGREGSKSRSDSVVVQRSRSAAPTNNSDANDVVAHKVALAKSTAQPRLTPPASSHSMPRSHVSRDRGVAQKGKTEAEAVQGSVSATAKTPRNHDESRKSKAANSVFTRSHVDPSQLPRKPTTEEQEVLEHCTFKPTINPASQRLFRKMEHRFTRSLSRSESLLTSAEATESPSFNGNASSAASLLTPASTAGSKVSSSSVKKGDNNSAPRYIPSEELILTPPPPLNAKLPLRSRSRSPSPSPDEHHTTSSASSSPVLCDEERMRRLAAMRETLDAMDLNTGRGSLGFRPFLGR